MMWLPKTMSGRRDAQNLIDQHSLARRAKLLRDIPEMPVLVDFSAPAPKRRTPTPTLTFRAQTPPLPTQPYPSPPPLHLPTQYTLHPLRPLTPHSPPAHTPLFARRGPLRLPGPTPPRHRAHGSP